MNRTQLEALKATRDCLERSTPRKPEGAIMEPFQGWISRCAREIDRAEAWLRASEGQG